MNRTRTILSAILLMMAIATSVVAQRYNSIRPGQRWLDTDGKLIHAHGFQIFEKDGTYYWYGENKEHTKLDSNVWTWGIRAYRSKDFYNWEDLGLIIPPDTVNALSPLHFSQTLDRPHILYNKKTDKWVCWIKSMDTDGFFVILQADKFEGPYTLVKSLKPEGFGVGDFDMYCDPQTGKGYVWFERPHWEMICAELTDDFLGTNGKFSEHFVGIRPPFTREAPSHFVWRDKHYMFTSGTTGYVPNPSKVAVFDDYHGEYTDLGDPCIDDRFEDSFGSQITSVIKIPGKNLYVALADRWMPHLYGTDIPKRILKNKETAYLNHKPFDRDFTTPQVKDKTGVKRNKWDTTEDARYAYDYFDTVVNLIQEDMALLKPQLAKYLKNYDENLLERSRKECIDVVNACQPLLKANIRTDLLGDVVRKLLDDKRIGEEVQTKLCSIKTRNKYLCEVIAALDYFGIFKAEAVRRTLAKTLSQNMVSVSIGSADDYIKKFQSAKSGVLFDWMKENLEDLKAHEYNPYAGLLLG